MSELGALATVIEAGDLRAFKKAAATIREAAARLAPAEEVVKAARWAHDRLNEDHDGCDCTCDICCGCFSESLGGIVTHEEWCQLGKALAAYDAAKVKP